jgi:ectoine hydroxylase-related dioxygenase (phytanoyl-CoA dioxygenase family)
MQTIFNPLSENQITEFYREGYIIAEQLVPHEAIDKILAEACKIPIQVGGHWTPKVFNHDDPSVDAALHHLLVEPAIVAATEQLFEAPARVLYGMLAVVPAKGGKGLEWHQDNMYEVVLGRALNCFIALCDITPDKAILWVAPKSHLKGIQESEIVDGHRKGLEPKNGMPLPGMKKGDVCIFDRTTLHHSKKNLTDEHRYAYAAQYHEEKARFGITGERDFRKMLVSDLRDFWQMTPTA